ncbi:MAG: glycosyltransferase family 4 protein [Bacteroidota bacterium]
MGKQDKKVLVFMLTRRGCLAYATPLVEQLRQEVPLRVYTSAYATERLPKDSIPIKTYRSGFEFFWNSLVRLPLFLWQLRRVFQQGYKTAYFPLFHPWNWWIMHWCKWWGLRIVFTVHDGVPHQGEQSLGAFRLRKWCIQSSDQLIFLSHFVQQQVTERYTFRGKATVIPHGIVHPSSLRKIPRQLPQKRVRLLFSGRLSAYKGLDLLLDAMAQLTADPRLTLTVAGMPINGYQLPTLPENTKVIAKWLAEEELAKLLQEHNISILPYIEASQSGVIPLGIAAGLPMICTKVGGLPEQLTKEEAVWVAPEVDSLVTGIKQLASDPILYADLHQKMLAKQATLSWEAVAQKVATFL